MIEMIKELRARTHLGMSECKKAIEEAGNIEGAILLLQKKGLKKTDDLVVPIEGQVRASVVKSSITGHITGFMTEVNCQTDFGARSEVFENFMSHISSYYGVPESLKIDCDMLSKQLGEKIVIRRIQHISNSANNILYAYNHPGGKIAVLVALSAKENSEAVVELAEHIAMHVAATKPLCVSRGEVPADLVEKKRAFFQDDPVVKSKKPEQAVKIVEGKMNKWYSESVLSEQESVVEPKQTISAIVDRVSKEVGPVSIVEFTRYERGEQL